MLGGDLGRYANMTWLFSGMPVARSESVCVCVCVCVCVRCVRVVPTWSWWGEKAGLCPMRSLMTSSTGDSCFLSSSNGTIPVAISHITIPATTQPHINTHSHTLTD